MDSKLKNLTFGEAIELLKVGNSVKRKDWGGKWFLADTVDGAEPDKYYGMFILAELKSGGCAPAVAYQEDMLAEDWEVV